MLHRWWPELLAVLAAAAVYAPAIGFSFVFDDHALIGADGWPAWLGGDVPYRPVRWASYRIDGLLGGSPAVYHAHNIAWHALVGALTASVARRLGASAFAAALGSLLLIAHPLAVEAVAYVAGRRDVVAVAMAMISLLAWMHGRPIAAAMAMTVAAGAKESALAFLPVLAAASACALAPGGVRAAATVSAAATLGVSLVAAYGVVGPFAPEPTFAAIAAVGRTLVHYVANLVWPVALSPEYPALRSFMIAQTSAASLVSSVAAAVALTAAAALACRACVQATRDRSSRAAAFCAAWVVTMLAALAIWGSLHEPGADRHAYLALPALAVSAAVFLTRATSRLAYRAGIMPLPAAAATAIACVLIPVLTAATRTAMLPWKDDRALWRHAVTVAPSSPRARHNLAALLADQGEYALAQRQLAYALRADPRYVPAHLGKAAIRCARGRPAAARIDLLRALELGAPAADVGAIAGRCSLVEFAGLASANAE